MISKCPLKSAPQPCFGTEVPKEMANAGGHEGPVVLLDGKDLLAKLARAIHPSIAEESKPGEPLGVVTYETQDNHTLSPDLPDAGFL